MQSSISGLALLLTALAAVAPGCTGVIEDRPAADDRDDFGEVIDDPLAWRGASPAERRGVTAEAWQEQVPGAPAADRDGEPEIDEEDSGVEPRPPVAPGAGEEEDEPAAPSLPELGEPDDDPVPEEEVPPVGTSPGGGNAWSWDGSWAPTAADLPLAGLYDEEYDDGHLGPDGLPTPILPPGDWDWDDSADDLSNWRSFRRAIGTFEPLIGPRGNHFGWRLVPHEEDVDFTGPGAYFQGSSGTDILNLGDRGYLHGFGAGRLGDGPDVLVFDSSSSLDFRTGSTSRGDARDNDLVIAGCTPAADGGFDILTSTVHTGPGDDLIFARDLSRAALDLGNGADGRTDTLDPDDGDDIAVLRGNTHDFRVFGGNGSDTVFWHVDDNLQTTTWLGPNFFGGGGAGAALWNDRGTDRLVLDVPSSTTLVTSGATAPGELLVLGTDGGFIDDTPTAHDPFATYCIECGTAPDGRRTLILEYVSADGSIRTGYFFVTAFEELQIGVGPGARVMDIDSMRGRLSPSAALPTRPPAFPASRCL